MKSFKLFILKENNEPINSVGSGNIAAIGVVPLTTFDSTLNVDTQPDFDAVGVLGNITFADPAVQQSNVFYRESEMNRYHRINMENAINIMNHFKDSPMITLKNNPVITQDEIRELLNGLWKIGK